jgi:hypothetical protein
LSPDRILRLNASGEITASWHLPACVNGVGTRTDPSKRVVYVETNIGYGHGSCGKSWNTRIALIDGSQLRPVTTIANRRYSGWTGQLAG